MKQGGKVGFRVNAYLTKRVKKSDGKCDTSGRPAQSPIKCPQCSSQKTWKDGVRKTNFVDIQRYLCRECGFRFSVNGLAKSFYMESSKRYSYQIGAVPKDHGQVINLVSI